MTTTEFSIAVQSMRDCQRRYFATHADIWIIRYKEYERIVDQEIERYRAPMLPFEADF